MATRLSQKCFVAAASVATVATTIAPRSRVQQKCPTCGRENINRHRCQEESGREGWRGAPEGPSIGGAAADASRRSLLGGGVGSPVMDSLRQSWQGVVGSALSGNVVYADAAAPDSAPISAVAEARSGEGGEGGGGGGNDDSVSSMEDGEKPEFIQRADEQAEQMKQQLRRPAQFADQFGEVSQLTQVHSFEGFRLDMSKAVTPTFFTSHNIFSGNPQFPNGHYQGTLTVVGENETMVRASMDAECNVNMEVHAPLGLPGLMGKLTVHQGKNELLQGTAVYLGETWAGQVSVGSGPADVSYNQAVTQRLSVGGQGQFSAAQQAVGLLYGFKYNTPSWAVLGRLVGGGANLVTAQYLRRVVPGRVSLAAEYQAQLGAGSQMMVGAEFVLKQSKMSASVDCNGKVDSTLELKCGTFPTLPVTLVLSSSLDHSEDKHTFGLALSCGQ